MFENPEIIGAIIEGGATIVAALIAALTAGLIGREFANRDKLKDALNQARQDVLFLLAVEAEHCKEHIKTGSQSSKKISIRRKVKDSGKYKWSGTNIPSKIESTNLE